MSIILQGTVLQGSLVFNPSTGTIALQLENGTPLQLENGDTLDL